MVSRWSMLKSHMSTCNYRTRGFSLSTRSTFLNHSYRYQEKSELQEITMYLYMMVIKTAMQICKRRNMYMSILVGCNWHMFANETV